MTIMNGRILYLGDTALTQQASYLAGVMAHYKLDFDYVASDEKFQESLLNDCKAIIVSDYPAQNFSAVQIELILKKIKNGMGLLMIGGWESFVGSGGRYNKTAFTECLPVEMSDKDDRVNYSGPCVVVKNQNHKILENLPFETNAPMIGGFNKVKTKSTGVEILSAKQYKAEQNNGEIKFSYLQTSPLLVLSDFGKGNVAAFASDAAPHWVGSLVDWGNKRITTKAKGSAEVEVGNWYAQLFINMIRWVCKEL